MSLWRARVAIGPAVVVLILAACAPGMPSPAAPTAVSTLPPSSPTPMPSAAPTSRPTSPTARPATAEAPTLTPVQVPTVTSAPTRDVSTHLGLAREGGSLGKVWNLADVRIGVHPDRLRVVWQMAEPGEHVPRFRAVEVDNAASPFPTGHDPTWGAARIDLVVSDLYAYDFPLGQRLPLVLPDHPVVTRIGLYPTFSDAHLGFSIGLRRPSAFEVHELTDPVRIVIDVLWP